MADGPSWGGTHGEKGGKPIAMPPGNEFRSKRKKTLVSLAKDPPKREEGEGGPLEKKSAPPSEWK